MWWDQLEQLEAAFNLQPAGGGRGIGRQKETNKRVNLLRTPPNVLLISFGSAVLIASHAPPSSRGSSSRHRCLHRGSRRFPGRDHGMEGRIQQRQNEHMRNTRHVARDRINGTGLPSHPPNPYGEHLSRQIRDTSRMAALGRHALGAHNTSNRACEAPATRAIG